MTRHLRFLLRRSTVRIDKFHFSLAFSLLLTQRTAITGAPLIWLRLGAVENLPKSLPLMGLSFTAPRRACTCSTVST